jgi:hypothetical protein
MSTAQDDGAPTLYCLTVLNIIRETIVMEGYAQVAWRMSVYKETAIVRRFAELNVQNYSYMQAKLSRLEDRLKEKE